MTKEVPSSPTENQQLGILQGCLRASPGTMQAVHTWILPSPPHCRVAAQPPVCPQTLLPTFQGMLCLPGHTGRTPKIYSLPLERRRGAPLDARTSLFVRFPAVWRPPEQKGPSHSFCHPLYPPSGWKGLKCPGVAKQQDRIQ